MPLRRVLVANRGEIALRIVRAAIAAGLEFIVADPVLPPLLRAARLTLETATAPKEKQPQ